MINRCCKNEMLSQGEKIELEKSLEDVLMPLLGNLKISKSILVFVTVRVSAGNRIHTRWFK